MTAVFADFIDGRHVLAQAVLTLAYPLALNALVGGWMEDGGCSAKSAEIATPVATTLVVLVIFGPGQLRAQRRRRNVYARTSDLRRQLAEKERQLAVSANDDLSQLNAVVASGRVRDIMTGALAGSAGARRNAQGFIKATESTVSLVAQGVESGSNKIVERVKTARIAMEMSMAWIDRVEGVTRAYHTGELGNVFLGGSCNPTTWRKDTAMPRFDAAGVPYYNPQVDDWTPELVQIEAEAKEKAEVLLFVIDAQTRALASIVEASEYICSGRHVVLSIEDLSEGTSFGGDAPSSAAELKDLNRQRSYLRDVATRHGIPFASTVESACRRIVAFYKRARKQMRRVDPALEQSQAMSQMWWEGDEDSDDEEEALKLFENFEQAGAEALAAAEGGGRDGGEDVAKGSQARVLGEQQGEQERGVAKAPASMPARGRRSSRLPALRRPTTRAAVAPIDFVTGGGAAPAADAAVAGAGDTVDNDDFRRVTRSMVEMAENTDDALAAMAHA